MGLGLGWIRALTLAKGSNAGRVAANERLKYLTHGVRVRGRARVRVGDRVRVRVRVSNPHPARRMSGALRPWLGLGLG